MLFEKMARLKNISRKHEIRKEVGDKKGEATDCGNLANAFFSRGKYGEANDYFEKALEIRKGIGDRQGETAEYGN